MAPFRDRTHAGQMLATLLTQYADRSDVLVLALPRGGVPVGFEVARALHAPLDLMMVRKLGLPGREELAMGAIAWGDVRVINRDVVIAAGISRQTLAAVTEREVRELERRAYDYRGDRPAPLLTGRVVILIDDGLATGATMRVAALATRQQQPAGLVVAVPVGASETCAMLRQLVDRVVCAITPEPLLAVGYWYDDFSQIGDDQVRMLLALSAPDRLHARSRGAP